jgi:hypothetical protein
VGHRKATVPSRVKQAAERRLLNSILPFKQSVPVEVRHPNMTEVRRVRADGEDSLCSSLGMGEERSNELVICVDVKTATNFNCCDDFRGH